VRQQQRQHLLPSWSQLRDPSSDGTDHDPDGSLARLARDSCRSTREHEVASKTGASRQQTLGAGSSLLQSPLPLVLLFSEFKNVAKNVAVVMRGGEVNLAIYIFKCSVTVQMMKKNEGTS